MNAWITRTSVLLVAKPQAHGIHAVSLVRHSNSRDVFPKFQGERFIAGTWGCTAQHFPSPPIAISSCLCTGNPKRVSSSRMVLHRTGEGPVCRNTMPLSVISQAETQRLLSRTRISYRLSVHTPPRRTALAACSHNHWQTQAQWVHPPLPGGIKQLHM